MTLNTVKNDCRDIIFVKNLKCKAIIGIYKKERVKKQPVIIDVEIGVSSLRNASLKEDINLTISYEEVYNRILEEVRRNFFLLESLAEAIANFCLEYKMALFVKVCVRKTKIFKLSNSVGISIFRSK